MRWRDSLLLLPSSLAVASFSDVVPTKECPIQGPVYPSGFDLTKSDAIRNAKERFPQVVEKLFSSGAIDPELAYFTIDVFSTSTNESFFSYSHVATGLDGNLTAGVLNDETIWRTGSVSKLFTVYALVAAAGLEVLEYPVTRYLPELAGNSREDALTKIIWEDVTVGALASQQAGVGEFLWRSRHALQKRPVPPNVSCSNLRQFLLANGIDEVLLATMKDKTPVTLPWQTAMYADGGFTVLGQVLERISGMKYEEAIHNILSIPLGLTNTSTTLPTEENLNALILDFGPATTWGFDNQLTAPSGGVYANNADLRTLGLSILNNQLLSDAATREWMKPRGHTSTLAFSVGAPWEIDRMTIPVSSGSGRTRVSDLYTKGGGNPPYGAILSLSPEHGIGFSLLIAGPTFDLDRYTARDAIAEVFISAAEFAAADNAAENFVGTFAGDTMESTNLTLATEEGLPGLHLESFFIDGFDTRANITSPIGEVPALNVRLYPSGTVTQPSSDGVVKMAFNAVPYASPPNTRASIEGGEGLFDHACTHWFTTGYWYISGHAPDQFIFHVKAGRLTKIEYGFGGVTMERIE